MPDSKSIRNLIVYVIFVSFVLLCCFLLLELVRENEEEMIKPTDVDLLLERQFKRIKTRRPELKAKLNYHKNDHEVIEEQVTMAMDIVKLRLNDIRDSSRNIIKTQKRAPDSRYNINVTNSDNQSLDRSIPDTRPPVCKTFRYDRNKLPRTSVIIPFYNEALSMLLRTVHSVLNRSPYSLLEEIILVDDCSPDEQLQKPLASYVQMLPKVRLVRNKKRQGLIVSRMRGAGLAKGPVLIFLDAHSEANKGWLEPLLDELNRNRRQVVQPFVDGIDAMSLAIEDPGIYHKGSFSWDLRYTWIKTTHQEQMAAYETGLPFFTPTLVGCAIAVDKKYFEEIGNFDEGLKVWGGENIELGFRVWMCGGKVTTVTCSHVGHVFKEFPYTFDGDKEEIVQKNLIRVAETWMDGMKKYFYASTRVHDFKRAELNDEERESLKQRLELRKNLKCQNFEWYLYNIIPQLNEPPMDAVFHGEIANPQSKSCWEVTEDYYIALTYICYYHKIIPHNYFSLTNAGLMRYRDKCVTINPPNPMLAIGECPSTEDILAIEKFGIWKLESRGTFLQDLLSVSRLNSDSDMVTWCIEQVTNAMSTHKNEQMPQLSTCSEQNSFQHWSFTYAFDFSYVPKHAL